MITEIKLSECRAAILSVFPELPDPAVEKLAERLDWSHGAGLRQQWYCISAIPPESDEGALRKAAEYLRKAATRCRDGGSGAGLELQPFAYDLISASGNVPALADSLPEGVIETASYSILGRPDAIATVVGALEWQAAALDAAARAIAKNSERIRAEIEASGHTENGNRGIKFVARTVAHECYGITAEVTGAAPTMGRNPITDKITGTFYQLVSAAFKALAIDASSEAAAKVELARAARRLTEE